MRSFGSVRAQHLGLGCRSAQAAVAIGLVASLAACGSVQTGPGRAPSGLAASPGAGTTASGGLRVDAGPPASAVPEGQTGPSVPLPAAAGNQPSDGTPGDGLSTGRTLVQGRVGAAARLDLHVPILMYHLIGGADDPRALPGLVVPDALFLAQLRILASAGWRTIDLSTLADDLLAGRAPPAHRFVITFDDGHQDGYTQALPILLRLGDSATFFVITDRIGRAGYLTSAEIRRLAADGMDVGNHTVHHRDVAALSASRAVAEIDGAQAKLGEILGRPPTLFAYPAGEASPRAEREVAAAGLELALGNQPGAIESIRNRFLIPRIRVSASTSPSALLGMVDATLFLPSRGAIAQVVTTSRTAPARVIREPLPV